MLRFGSKLKDTNVRNKEIIFFFIWHLSPLINFIIFNLYFSEYMLTRCEPHCLHFVIMDRGIQGKIRLNFFGISGKGLKKVISSGLRGRGGLS